MSRDNYRIDHEHGYDGCFPITVYCVMVRREGFLCFHWTKVKCFAEEDDAEDLIDLLVDN